MHPDELIINKAHLDLYDMRDVDTANTYDYLNYFKCVLDKSDFPLVLKSNEQYNLVVIVENPPISVGRYLSNPIPTLHLSWSTPTLNGTVQSPLKIPFPLPNKKKLAVSFDVTLNPVPVHTIFSIYVTIYNFSEKPRHFILEVPLSKMVSDHRIFYNTASITMESHDGIDSEIDNSLFNLSSNLVQDFKETKNQLASLVCVENILRIGKIESRGQRTVRFDCLAMKEGLYTLDNMVLFDIQKKCGYSVENSCQIFITK